MNPHPDPFLFDTEQLQSLVAEPELRAGLADFRKQCVTELVWGEEQLQATVEDGDSGEPMQTQLVYGTDGNLLVDCECGTAPDAPCRHAAAMLYTYAAEQGDEQLLGAVDRAIEERVQRGRTEVRVTPPPGGAGFGAWQAQSITPSSHYRRSYRVNIRSLERAGNHCTCPDFATNQLGTCKHIEAVLHRLNKLSKKKRKALRPARPYVYLTWDVEDAPRIAIHRAAEMDEALNLLLDEYFDARGLFRGRLPDDYYRLAEQVEGRDDLDLGEDAAAHVRRLSTQAAQRERAGEIRARISAGGGHIPGVKARLYPYQVEGVAFLAANGRALLADDMGLGKTLQAIAAARWLYDQAGARRMLVACPASLKQQWAREIERFTGMAAQIIQGGAEARSVQYRRGEGFFIVNYELILRDLSIINEVLSPDLLILDEAQRIKNWRTKIAAAVKLIPSRYAFVLSGTPLENRLEDLYSLMQVVDPHVLGPLWRYLAEFHVSDERGKVLGYRNLSELRRRLQPVMLRRDRSLVREQLPERVQQRLDVPMNEVQLDLHGAAMMAAGSLAQIAQRRPLTPSEQNRLMAALQQARMACDAAGLVDKETEGSPKLDELADILDELCLQGGRKAVVFSQWEGMTRMVEQRLSAMGLGCVRLHGGVPTANRGALMDRFREDDAVQVFISTDAGGVGLNLQSASVLVNLDIPWNPAVLEQRIARIHRLGQRESVQVILMVAVDGYEADVFRLVQNKRNLFDNVIDPEASEDVVGVSPKLLEVLTQELAQQQDKEEATADDAQDTPPIGDEQIGKAAVTEPGSRDEGTSTAAIRAAIEQLQQRFGARLERVLGSGGGLLAVIDRVAEADDRYVAELSADLGEKHAMPIPLALIDPTTLRSLQRLGAASPVQEGTSWYDAAEQADSEVAPRLLRLAREKLAAAEILLGQSNSSALDLLIAALLAVAAQRADREQTIEPREAGVWLYAEAVPKGWLSGEQAALILRATGLAQAEQIPDGLMATLLEDAREFVFGE